MPISLPALPFAKESLMPHISPETLEYHYGKHHQSYVTNLNGLIEGTEFASMTLDEIVKKSKGGIFNNSAQIWNHTFYWNSLSPNGGGQPTGAIGSLIQRDFGSFEQLKEQMTKSAATNFGSGWTWLCLDADKKLKIVNTSNAETPLTDSTLKPLLTIDVWEHAYYIDYRNARPKYLEAFWALVNWEFANAQLG